MRLEQWFAERTAQARRRAEWHTKLAPLGEALRLCAEGVGTDPVTKLPILTVSDVAGPQDWIEGYRVDAFGKHMLTFKLSMDANHMRVDGVADTHPDMQITDVVPAGDRDVRLDFTTTHRKVMRTNNIVVSALVRDRLESSLHV